MAASAAKSLAGTLVSDDGSCTTGAAAVYDANGALPSLAPSRPAAALGGRTIRLPLLYGRTDTGISLTASAGAGVFGITNTTGTSLVLISEAANNNTKTDKVCWEITVPEFYKAGDNLTVTVSAKHTLNSGTASVKTIAVNAYLLAEDGTSGATLVATSAATTTTSTATYAFTITGTTLTPGARILVHLTAVVTETAAGGGVTLTVNSVIITA